MDETEKKVVHNILSDVEIFTDLPYNVKTQYVDLLCVIDTFI